MQGEHAELQGGRELNYVAQRDPYAGSLFTRIVEAINTLAKNAGVSAVGKFSAPPPVNRINVQGTLSGDTLTAPSEILHWTLDHSQAISKGIHYFSEVDTDPNFPNPHVIQHRSSRSAFLQLPAKDNAGTTHTYYLRSYAQYPGSDPCKPTVHGNLGAPIKIQLTGSSKTSILASTGSGTANADGQQGGSGFGFVLDRGPQQRRGEARRAMGFGTVTVIGVQATPTFSPVAGTYGATQNVTITSAGADNIYYTVDGSTPTTASTLYTGPVSVSTSETLKAIAVKAGWSDSAVGSAVYVISLYTTPTFVSTGIAQHGVSSGAVTINTLTATLLVAAQGCNGAGTVGEFWDDPGLAQMTITDLTSISVNVSATYTMNSYAGGAANALVGRAVWITGMANSSNNSINYAGNITASSTTSFTVALSNTGGMTTVSGQTATGVVGNWWGADAKPTFSTTYGPGGAADQRIVWASLPLTSATHIIHGAPNSFEGNAVVYAFAGGKTSGWVVDASDGGATSCVANAATTSTLTLQNTVSQPLCAFILTNIFNPTALTMSGSWIGQQNHGNGFANEAGGAAYLIAQAATESAVFTFGAEAGTNAVCQAIIAFKAA